MPDEGADDMDGNIGPPPDGLPFGGGSQTQQRLPLARRELAPYELWSCDEESGITVGFRCFHDMRKRVFYAKFEAKFGEDSDGSVMSEHGVDAERSTKGAITTLLDLAEACRSRKITLGLSAEDAGSAELVCSLLYLGFQVVPSRKSPLENTALLLDFDMGWPAGPPGGPYSSDYTCTATSDCSTSADEGSTSETVTDSS